MRGAYIHEYIIQTDCFKRGGVELKRQKHRRWLVVLASEDNSVKFKQLHPFSYG